MCVIQLSNEAEYLLWLYGFINSCLQSLVMEKFGQDTWDKLSSLPGVRDTFMTYTVYDDVLTVSLVQEACSLLNVSSDVFLKLFGEHFFIFCKQAGYDTMLRTLGGNLVEFIGNLDALHSYLALSYQEMNAPSFRVEMTDDGKMLLHYYSDRKGLYHIVPGIMEAVARDFFDTQVTMEVLNQSEEDERTGKKEHVVFLVNQASKSCCLSQSDSSAETIESTSTDEDDHREINTDGRYIQPPGRCFLPCYPKRLWMEGKAFCDAFPFHIVFDEQLKVRQMGVNIQKFVPGLQVRDAKLDQFFTLVHPQVTFTIESIRKFINSQFVLKSHKHIMLKLRGQMVWMESLACMLYLCSPKLRSLQELQDVGLHLADLAQHDVTRDLVLLNQQRLAEMELTNQLERKKEELRILSRHLEAEKEKTETLLYAMLPRHIANQLKDGKSVEAGEFEVCTILFSDVVTFTNICAACEPIHIVHMLNSMYSKFDRLTSIHDIYKVETIGDAYMVVGGVPVPTHTHAHRVANFALGMRIAAREVTNPVTGKPIQIRVGLHTGPVLAGVVGEKMPRYCLFGDTVNTASRMESHGVPDHIHLSSSTHRELKDAGFDLKERGQIEVKGKGQMTTFFLMGNLTMAEESIMGKADGVCLYREELHSDKEHDTGPEVRPETEKSDKPSGGDPGPDLFSWDITPPYQTDSNTCTTPADNINSKLCVLL
ncbi:LOW QUALITY PROTEIN: guanylate cyclase soluble subunit beta-2-like [Xyrichtys novacula]|uniref:guanylate cyclase n=1 Tax=Xyrichtys novacula TaxID=13765 RepID=A0AAV1HQP6_XYRNO|nr:LOW QUALITY PROTEIN: guanylate cyclase soluble subunit beta-2-like [Xyrichtys novacula]